MGWKEDVWGIVEDLPRTFGLEDLIRYVPFLSAKYPDNRHVREKIRQTLQVLRDEGRLEFLGQAEYHRLKGPDNPLAEFLEFEPGMETTRAELAELFGMEGAAPLGRGMFKRKSGPFRNQMLLFHNELLNPYGDRDERDRIVYVGQGRDGDQVLEGHNRTLADHLELGVRVHYFVQPRDRPGKVVYRGEVVVQDVQEVYRPEERRAVIEYTLLPIVELSTTKLGPLAYGKIYADILEDESPHGPIQTTRPIQRLERVLRNRAFRLQVLKAYEEHCAVCGDPIRTAAGSELEAAHIMAVSRRGPDRVQNGICLCGRHHWAFDSGAYTLLDDYTIRWLLPVPDPHGEVRTGQQIALPSDEVAKPNSVYLEAHRAIWARS